jgi:RNA polymerase sigma factor (sigma-70 family)
MPAEPSPITSAFLDSSSFLKRFIASFLKAPQDIEDVAQETYLRAYVAEQRETIDQPKAFLFRVAKNLALTKLTKKSRQITDYIEEASATVVIETAAGSDEVLEAQECLDLYCEAVAALPEKCRQVFLFRKVHGLSHKDIGERMGLSVSSVEKYLRQGVLTCQRHLQEREGAPVPSEAPLIEKRGKAKV